tara:strand:+ start:372 stop:605 length:234 start_codon:yes stop_codon:yes gene_type:complete
MSELNKLEDYRKRNNFTYKMLAQKLDVSVRTAIRHCRPLGATGFHLPQQKTMERIIILTEGYVQPNDFYHVSLKKEI